MKPQLTVNYGLRWEVQMPFKPTTDTFSTTTLRGSLRRVRRRVRARGPAVQSVPAGQPVGRRVHAAPTRSTTDNAPGYNTEWGNFAPNVGVAWRPNVRDGWLRDSARRSGAGDGARRFLGELQPGAHGSVHRRLRQQPGRHDEREPQRRQRQPRLPGRELADPAARDVAARPAGDVRRRRRQRRLRAADAGVSDRRDGRQQPQHLRSRTLAPVHAVVVVRLPALAHQRLGDRDPLSRQPQRRTRGSTENWNERNIDRERLPRRVQARAGEPAGEHRRAAAATTFAYFGDGTGTSPLPIYLGVLHRRADGAGERSEPLHVRELHEHGLDRPPRAVQPGSGGRGQRPAQRRDAPPAGAQRRPGAELLRHEPVDRRGEHRPLVGRQPLPLAAARVPPPPVAAGSSSTRATPSRAATRRRSRRSTSRGSSSRTTACRTRCG